MNTEERETKTKKEKDEVQVTVSLEHEDKLQRMLALVNEGFDLGKVSRKQVLAHIIDVADSDFDDEDVQTIRRNSTSDIALLDQAVREIKRTGVVPEALRELLWKSSNLTQGSKRPKKTRQSDYSNAIPQKEEAT
ncbi:MAG: hypothetical protein JNM39_07640 [Bdellovibrionaceae bacterium]|nr:hypothetical protein [Pseudobdellovibrionaceae bacterium]